MAQPTSAPISAEPGANLDSAADVGVAAVNRALSILDAFSATEPRLTLAQLSHKTGLYKSTILRLIESLEAFGYLKRGEDGSYSLGAAPLRLAAIYHNSLQPAELILPVLRELVALTRESASFYVMADDRRLCAYRVDSPRSIRDHVQVGQLLPLDKGAAGTVLRAFSGGGDAACKRARRDYLVCSQGERDPETSALSAPVLGAGDTVEGALCVSGPRSRFTAKAVAAIRPLLLIKAAKLTLAFGGDAAGFPC